MMNSSSISNSSSSGSSCYCCIDYVIKKRGAWDLVLHKQMFLFAGRLLDLRFVLWEGRANSSSVRFT